jgi:hypothetical protein
MENSMQDDDLVAFLEPICGWLDERDLPNTGDFGEQQIERLRDLMSQGLEPIAAIKTLMRDLLTA